MTKPNSSVNREGNEKFTIGNKTGTIFVNGDPTGTEVRFYNERGLTKSGLLEALNSHAANLRRIEEMEIAIKGLMRGYAYTEFDNSWHRLHPPSTEDLFRARAVLQSSTSQRRTYVADGCFIRWKDKPEDEGFLFAEASTAKDAERIVEELNR